MGNWEWGIGREIDLSTLPIPNSPRCSRGAALGWGIAAGNRFQTAGEDVSVFTHVFEADRDVFRHSGLFHGDAVKRVGPGHRLFRMGDDDKLRKREELAEDLNEAADVGFVQRGIDFVEDAERAGLAAEDCQQERDAGERFFAAREERDAASFLAGGTGHDVDAAFEDVFGIFEQDVGLAAPEEPAKELAEVAADDFERGEEQLSAIDVDPLNNFFKRGFGFLEFGKWVCSA